MRCNAFSFIQGLLCFSCAIEGNKNCLVGGTGCWPVLFHADGEEERCLHRIEHLERDTPQKPAMSSTQTMRCHCNQEIIVIFLRIRDDLCCWVSLQNFRLYLSRPFIYQPPGYVRQVIPRLCHLLVKPVLG